VLNRIRISDLLEVFYSERDRFFRDEIFVILYVKKYALNGTVLYSTVVPNRFSVFIFHHLSVQSSSLFTTERVEPVAAVDCNSKLEQIRPRSLRALSLQGGNVEAVQTTELYAHRIITL
jgi:hypothetical protein